jgi:glucose-6-phosphate dehydrogenase assembly protein OpcA
LTPWRRIIAQFFDPPDMRPHLDGLTALDIQHAAGSDAQAHLLVGWLAARLGWQLEGETDGAYRLRNGDHRLSATLRTRPSLEGPPGSLFAVRLAAGSDATFSAELSAPQQAMIKTQTPKAGLQRIVRLAGADDPEMLAQELQTPGDDPVFKEALAMAAALVDG